MTTRRPLVALISAEAFSITGTRLSTIAIPWLILTTTGSATLTGAVAFAEMVPYVVGKALGGPLIDRVGARRVTLLCDGLSVPVLALIPLLHLAGLLHLTLLFPLVFVLGALRGPSDGAKAAMIPDVAELAGVPLERATGLHGAVERLGTTVGAALAGGLVALIGPELALGVTGAGMAIGALLILIGVPVLPRAGADDTAPYLTRLRSGWAFLRGDRVLVGITVMVALTNLLDQAFTVVLLPVWADRTGSGASAVGMVFAVFAAASIAGALIASAKAERLPRLPVYTVAFLLTGLPRFLALGLGAETGLLVATLIVGGFASGFINPILGAVIFERIPAGLRGRVSTLNTSVCWSLIPFGGLLGGALVALVDYRAAFALVGVAYAAVTLMPLVRPSFREFSRRPEPVAPVSVGR